MKKSVWVVGPPKKGVLYYHSFMNNEERQSLIKVSIATTALPSSIQHLIITQLLVGRMDKFNNNKPLFVKLIKMARAVFA